MQTRMERDTREFKALDPLIFCQNFNKYSYFSIRDRRMHVELHIIFVWTLPEKSDTVRTRAVHYRTHTADFVSSSIARSDRLCTVDKCDQQSG